jgi:hypothetical protein
MILGPKKVSFRSITLMILISVSFTTLAFEIGQNINLYIKFPQVFELKYIDFFANENWKQLLTVYFVNMIFDFLTLLTTGFLLKKVLNCRPFFVFPILFADLMVAFFLSVGCLASSLWGYFNWGNNSIEFYVVCQLAYGILMVKLFALLPAELEPLYDLLIGYAPDLVLSTIFTQDKEIGFWPEFLYQSTTLIPTLVYLSLLLVLLAAKPILEVNRWFVKRFLKAADENDIKAFMPFSLLGLVLNFIAALIKTSHHFLSINN